MKLSKEKTDKIKESILSILYRNAPKAMFTVDIASDLIRDEEFTKKLLLELEKNNFVIPVKKNSEGITYLKRIRWRLSSKIYEAYSKLNQQSVNYDEKTNTYF